MRTIEYLREICRNCLGGEPLDDARTYVCATSDYLIEQAAKYFGLDVPEPDRTALPLSVRDALERAVRSGAVNGPLPGRNQEEGAAAPVGAGLGH